MLGREEIADKGWAAWSRSARAAPRSRALIVLRYAGGGSGPTLGLVGKGVTFDTGGISIKPGAGMQEMKMDMSGAAAVLEAVGAIAELRAARSTWSPSSPRPRTCPRARAIKPGDIITQYNGKTVEVNNTDAEGRLILADALAYAVELGAERIVDLATLTGAVDGRPRLDLRGADLQRRRPRRRGREAGERRPASWSGACPSTPSTRS